jgi:hypothetical protein
MTVPALAHAEYRKSSYSSATGACVMIGFASGWVGIRDGKQQDPRPTLPVTAAQFAALLDYLR